MMTASVVEAEWVFAAPGREPPVAGARVTLEGGRIASVEPWAGVGRGRAILPALVDAHDHGRGLRPASFGAADQPLETWIASLRQVPGVDLYASTIVAFGRLALSGVGAVSHVHLPGGGDVVEEARAVARAAADVGVRVAFALPVVDANAFAYGGPEAICACHRPEDWSIVRDWDGWPVPATEQMAAVEAVAAACESPTFTVQYGPAGPQWVTEEGLAALALRSAADGRRVHMHLLESLPQRQWADRHYPGGLLPWLDGLGLLSPRLTLAHGVWLRDDEIALLAERGATVALNTSSNLRLRSGIAPVARFVAAGLRIAMGLDGLAFNDDEDALFELRLLAALHAPRGFSTEGLSRGQAWAAATEHGRFTIDGASGAGRVAAGADADLMVVDMDAVLGNGESALCEPLDLLMSRAARRHVTDLWVAGRRVVADGRLTGIDLAAAEAELASAARSGAASGIAEQPLMRRHLEAVRTHYRDGGHLARRDERSRARPTP